MSIGSRMKTPDQIRDAIRAKRLAPDSRTPFRYRWLWSLMTSDLDPAEKLQGVAIWMFSDEDGANAWPSQSTIGAMVGRHVSSIKRGQTGLREAGYLSMRPGSGKASTRYGLTMPDIRQQTLTELDATMRGFTGERTPRSPMDGQSVHPWTPTNAYDQRSEPTHHAPPAATGLPNNSLREVYDDARTLALRMKEIDHNKLLGTPLFTNDGYATLAELIATRGRQHVEIAIRSTILEVGSPLRRGQIRTWTFFTTRASADYIDLPRGA